MCTPFDLDTALDRMHGRGPALVFMHNNPDPDSMATAECLRVLLEKTCGMKVTVARSGIIGRAENRALVATLGLNHVPAKEVDLKGFDVFALVDTQPDAGNNALPLGHKVDIVVDHHPQRPTAKRAAWCDVRDDVGASTTIALSYLRQKRLAIDACLATAVLYALKSDTRDLLRGATPHEHEAFSFLLKIADFDKLQAIVDPKVPAAHFIALDRALRAAEIRGPLLTVNLGTLDYPDLVAEIADLLLPYDHAEWVLCMGHYQGDVYVSLRTSSPNEHAGCRIQAIFGDQGASGGHGAAAGGRLNQPIYGPAELARVYLRLVESMERELGISEVVPVSLLSV